MAARCVIFIQPLLQGVAAAVADIDLHLDLWGSKITNS